MHGRFLVNIYALPSSLCRQMPRHVIRRSAVRETALKALVFFFLHLHLHLLSRGCDVCYHGKHACVSYVKGIETRAKREVALLGFKNVF